MRFARIAPMHPSTLVPLVRLVFFLSLLQCMDEIKSVPLMNATNAAAAIGSITSWSDACAWLRQRFEKIQDLPTWSALLPFFFPGLWRGKSHFSPLKASLMQMLLGPEWYERTYSNDKGSDTSLWLTEEGYRTWKTSPIATSAIRDNLEWCLQRQALLLHLSGLGWAKLVASAFDFGLLDQFERLWQLSMKMTNLSLTERALLHLTY